MYQDELDQDRLELFSVWCGRFASLELFQALYADAALDESDLPRFLARFLAGALSSDRANLVSQVGARLPSPVGDMFTEICNFYPMLYVSATFATELSTLDALDRLPGAQAARALVFTEGYFWGDAEDLVYGLPGRKRLPSLELLERLAQDAVVTGLPKVAPSSA